MSSTLLKQFVCLKTVNILRLDCVAAFNCLTQQEKLYSYYLSRAFAEGNRIVAIQTSPESPSLLSIFQKVFTYQRADTFKKEVKEKLNIDEEPINDFLIYACNVFGNMGNYRSFGDTKIFPALSRQQFEKILFASTAFEKENKFMTSIYNKIQDQLFDISNNVLRIGIDNHGINTYYSPNVTRKDAEFIQQFLNENKIQAWNTRLWKLNDAEYELRLASSERLPVKEYHYQGVTIKIVTGDYSPIMKSMCDYLSEAIKYASNDTQKKALELYIQSFTTGDIEKHIEGSKYWIQDKGPVVENYNGFIETYRDPVGVRGEYEGFVAIQNKEMTLTLQHLVEQAPVILPLLPWGKEYERDKFSKPDFTSIDILTYACGGLPSGINIPNYEEVRQTLGFKNYLYIYIYNSLGNVINAHNSKDRVTFIREQDQQLYKRANEAFSVQVGLHELLGHGSGKLFLQEKDKEGKEVFNFNYGQLKNIVTGEPVTSFYKDGESWTSLYKDLANPYEECRAESVGIYLCILSL
ncbi:hypothetical protein WA158_007342 [Blastocystis sp. Blastoise]